MDNVCLEWFENEGHNSGVLFKKVVNLSGQIVQDGSKMNIFLLQAIGWISDTLKNTKYE